MENQGKTPQQRIDSITFFSIAAIGMCILMLIATCNTSNKPDPITLDDYLDGTEKNVLDTLRSIMPNGKGIIEYPDGTCDSIRWFKESSLKIRNNDTVSIDAIMKRFIIEEDGIRWYSIDTIWSNEIDYTFDYILDAIIHVESSGSDSAYAPSEDAVGCLQIRKCMVDDVNRILKRQGATGGQLYTYEDRWERVLSIEMFQIYCDHYNLTTAEEVARCWNGGPRGMSYTYTEPYWDKVLSFLQESSDTTSNV